MIKTMERRGRRRDLARRQLVHPGQTGGKVLLGLAGSRACHWAPQTAALPLACQPPWWNWNWNWDWDCAWDRDWDGDGDLAYKTGTACPAPQPQPQPQPGQNQGPSATNNTMEGAWDAAAAAAAAHIKRESAGLDSDWYSWSDAGLTASAQMAVDDCRAYVSTTAPPPPPPPRFDAFPSADEAALAFWTPNDFPVSPFVPVPVQDGADSSWFAKTNASAAYTLAPGDPLDVNKADFAVGGCGYMDAEGSSFGRFSSAATSAGDAGRTANPVLTMTQQPTLAPAHHAMATTTTTTATTTSTTPWAPRVRPSQLTVSPQQLRLRPSPTPVPVLASHHHVVFDQAQAQGHAQAQVQAASTSTSTSTSTSRRKTRTALPDKPRAKNNNNNNTNNNNKNNNNKAEPSAPPTRRSRKSSTPAETSPSRRHHDDNDERSGADADDDRHRKNMFLVRHKMAGMTYKEIRRAGGFTEAESTLRGRFRTLTKNREERVRRPEWTATDVRLLEEAVRRLARPAAEGADLASAKIPWKQVAEYIVAHGGTYLFGNSTCRKRWDDLVTEAAAAGKDINESFFVGQGYHVE